MQEKTIGQKIFELRKQKGYSQEELGERVGVSRQAVSKWESDETFPNADKIKELCIEFQVSADYFLFGAENALEKSPDNAVNAEGKISSRDEKELAVSDAKSPKKRMGLKTKLLIYCFTWIGALLLFICFATCSPLFTTNRGLETVHSFTFENELTIVFLISAISLVFLIGLIVIIVTHPRKK